ncbi:MAG TPA: glycosyltransferase family 39 protein, partial [Myxococcota bacterium]|nr:glycosyltransferase family 39 protein [Myxococcota bacterium]
MLLVALCFGEGMQATDDLDYADAAISLLGGAVPAAITPHHHEARLSVILPLAAIFSLAGTSDASIALLPLACTALTASLIGWLAARSWGSRVGLSAGLLYASLPLPISLATVCVPEPVLTFALCAATVIFTSGDQRGSGAFLAGALVGVAYLATEVGAIMLPVFLLYRLLERGLRLRDAWLVAGFLVVFGLELAFHAALHGDAFYRFTLWASYPEDPLGRLANEDLVRRLLAAYPSVILPPSTTFGLFGPLLALGGVYACFRLRECGLFLSWAAAILLFYDLMSSSLTRYVALPVSARLIAPACAPLAILSAKALVDLWDWLAQTRSAVLRRTARGLAVAVGVVVGAVSLLSMYLNGQPSLTAAAAHNAKALNEWL